MYLVSACLLGTNCRYDGGSFHDERLLELARQGMVIPVCPEQLGGCGTPRPPCEICGGSGGDVLDGRCRVVNARGEDITDNFIKGANETLKLAETCGAQKAILKARSPSCGHGRIYDGTFSGKIIGGNGVTAELLVRNGIEVFSEEDFRE
jgi:uncharacterized protein YbbK (DUF523 family)